LFATLEGEWREVFAGGPARVRAIAASCRHKAAIVGRDEFEAGDRALLNLGHTFGHALEAAAGYSGALLHGEAVALGLVLAFDLSVRLGLCDPAVAQRISIHLAAVGLPVRLRDMNIEFPDTEKLIALMAQDKKVRDGATVFILARGIGEAFVATGVELSEVRALLEAARH
jgi:3-dehydroquinate synthetase